MVVTLFKKYFFFILFCIMALSSWLSTDQDIDNGNLLNVIISINNPYFLLVFNYQKEKKKKNQPIKQ